MHFAPKWLRKGCGYAVAVTACVLCSSPGHASKRVPATVVGAYQIEFRGALTGNGQATVTPTLVNIQGTVRDEAGNTSTLITTSVPLNNGRFAGTGAAMGRLPVQISGRVDPPSSITKVARFSCLFSTDQNRHGRIIGAMR
jgi:hypothetical protein